MRTLISYFMVLLGILVVDHVDARSIKIIAPDIAENGAVVPISVEISPPLVSGEMLSFRLGGENAGGLMVQTGELSFFSTRFIMNQSTSTVIVNCDKCTAPAQRSIRVILGAERRASHTDRLPESIMVRSNPGELRALASIKEIVNGQFILDGIGLIVSVKLSKHTSSNPFFQFRGSLRQGNHCVVLATFEQKERAQSCVTEQRLLSATAAQNLDGFKDVFIDMAIASVGYDGLRSGGGSSQAPRPVEAPRSATPLLMSASASQPSPDGVVTLSITTNNATASLKINGDEEGGRADGRYSVRRFARVGENKFEVVATDRFGNTQRQTVSVVREPADTTVRFATLNPGALRGKPANNAVAIIIGIQDYRRVPKAEFANNDARVFYDYAIRGLGVRPENVKLLVDQQADDVEILGAFKNWLPLKAKRGQADIYVFYSGHGLPSDDGASLYFLPHGVDRQFLDRTAIKQAEIVSALQAVSPNSVTLFLDACYSGQSRTGETLLAGARPISIQPKASTFPSNFTVLSASAPEQIASSSPELKHGIFSYFLMKGMEGEADQNKDGVITVQEMQSYLSDSVGRKAMALSRTQQPQVVGDQAKVLVGR